MVVVGAEKHCESKEDTLQATGRNVVSHRTNFKKLQGQLTFPSFFLVFLEKGEKGELRALQEEEQEKGVFAMQG